MTAVLTSRSPWKYPQVVAEIPAATVAQLDAAVACAARTFPRWQHPDAAAERRAALERWARVLTDARTELIEALITEAGKTRTDAAAEAELLPRKIAITLEEGLRRTAPGESPVRWRARGVALCLGPFNFPLHLVHGLVVPAVAMGATVVAKPSPSCPALGELYARLVAQAGVDDVVRIVQGGAAEATYLVRHPQVATVAAVGSRSMGLALSAALVERPEVVLALELGGVNQALVLPDASLEPACVDLADGAWRMAGQRCTATRVVHVPRARLAEARSALARERRRWVTTTPEGTGGMMIDPQARERFQAPYRALPPGITLLEGSPLPMEQACACDPLLLQVDPEGRTQELYREEHFGPALLLDPYDDPEDALARMNRNPYRLAASVFTASLETFRSYAARLPYGQVNRNRPTAGARSEWPFGGCGLSGNNRPAGVAATRIFADETVIWE